MKTRFPPQRILVAIDGSDASWTALEEAGKIALRLNSRLDLVHVEALVPEPQFEPGLSSVEADSRAKLKLGVTQALAHFPSDRWSFAIIKGQPSAELARRAAPRHAQLLVMGTHARSGGERFLMGSTAEAVFHRARIPVLALRAGQTIESGRILVPCHFERYADEALKYALEWGRAFNAQTTALYVPTRPEWDVDADDQLRRHIDKAFGTQACGEIERVIRQGEPREEIARESQTGRYSLVVLSGHQRAQLSDLALGTTAERLLRSCQAPMLVVPADHPRRGELAATIGAALSGRRP